LVPVVSRAVAQNAVSSAGLGFDSLDVTSFTETNVFMTIKVLFIFYFSFFIFLIILCFFYKQ